MSWMKLMFNIFFGIILTFTISCEYVPRKTFKLITKDGIEISLTCPVVDSRRSMITYIIDGQCVIEPQEHK